MDYRNILPLVSHTQEFSTDYWNDFGYWNDGTFWYEKTPTYTARVTAYAAATGITDYTILDPLNIFDLGLTYYGLDTIMKALYPMVTDKISQSDMANQMKYNFMNPLDTNPAFRLNWVGGWVYSRTGALPNGVNAYADTNLIPSTALTLNNVHISYYSRTSTLGSGNRADIGSFYSNDIPQYSYMIFQSNGRGSDNNAVGYISMNDPGLRYTQTNAAKFITTTRTADNSIKIIENGVVKSTNTTVQTSVYQGLPQISIYLGAINYRDSLTPQNALLYSQKECAFASIGNGLTDFQADIFSTLVNNLQKALNRAVY